MQSAGSGWERLRSLEGQRQVKQERQQSQQQPAHSGGQGTGFAAPFHAIPSKSHGRTAAHNQAPTSVALGTDFAVAASRPARA